MRNVFIINTMWSILSSEVKDRQKEKGVFLTSFFFYYYSEVISNF